MTPCLIAASRSTWSEPIPAVSASFSFLRLREAFGRQIGGPEGLRDHHLRIGQLAIEDRALAVLVGRHDQLVAEPFEEPPQAEFARHAAQQCSGLEVDTFGRGKCLPAGIPFQLRQIVPGIRLRIPVNWVIIKNTQYFGHVPHSLFVRASYNARAKIRVNFRPKPI